MASQFSENVFVLPTIALEEVGHKSAECVRWLKSNGTKTIDMDNPILHEAMRIKGLLGVSGDKYSPKGVDENDLFIIATAKINNLELVTDEARQAIPPQIMANMKIPAVCNLATVKVDCISFVELIKRSKAVFS